MLSLKIKNQLFFSISLLFIISCAVKKKPDAKPDVVEFCQDCYLTLICHALDTKGNLVEYIPKNADGSAITQIPTTINGETGNWSCPAYPPDAPNAPKPFSDCTSDNLDLSKARSNTIFYQSFILVNKADYAEKLALDTCKKQLPANTVFFQYGFRSDFDISPNKTLVHQVISKDKPLSWNLPFNRFVALGDSMTDNANGWDNKTTPMYPYVPARFSSGYVWVEQIVKKFNLSSKQIELLNVAYPGVSISLNLGDTPIILGTEADYVSGLFDTKNQPGETKFTAAQTVFSLMSGMIDSRDIIEDYWINKDPNAGREPYYYGRLARFITDGDPYSLDPNVLAQKTATKLLLDSTNSIEATLAKLSIAGAKYFIIPELPDFLKLPRYNGLQTIWQPDRIPLWGKAPVQMVDIVNTFATNHVLNFNKILNDSIPKWEAKYNIKIVKIDMFDIINQLTNRDSALAKSVGIQNPSLVGGSAAALPIPFFYPTSEINKLPPDKQSQIQAYGTPKRYDPATSVFWDDVHPTETTHCVIAERTIQLIYQKLAQSDYQPDYAHCAHSFIKIDPITPPSAKKTRTIKKSGSIKKSK